MKRKRKRKLKTAPEKNDFVPDCECAKKFYDSVERERDGFRFLVFHCEKCDTYGRRPIGFVFKDADNIPVPDFSTLQTDSETKLYWKLNFLSQAFPNRKTQILIAATKHELKTRFDALKYDNPNEGTREHWLETEKAKQQFLEQMPE